MQNNDNTRLACNERERATDLYETPSQDRVVGIVQREATTGPVEAVSQARVDANRQNAKKSTGPKTARGKRYSRKNALKHGLFALAGFERLGEDPDEYHRLQGELYKQYQPVGKAEELEVEFIGVCWWKRKRAWLFEHSSDRISLPDLAKKFESYVTAYETEDQEEKTLTTALRGMQAEIEESGVVPPDLKDRFRALKPESEWSWQSYEDRVREKVKELLSRVTAGPAEKARFVAEAVLREAIRVSNARRVIADRLCEAVLKDQLLIPGTEALDKILRYEAAIDRHLGRAIDRLERLQRRRTGEAVPPPVSVRLTR